MSIKWTARLTMQIVCGFVALVFAEKLFPTRARPEDFKLPGVILTAMAGVLVVADGFFAAAVKKLDEPITLPSFSILERKKLRAELRRLEISLTASFYIATISKALFALIGVILSLQLVSNIAADAWMNRKGFFLLGFALPTIVLMPRAYFAFKAARAELVELEEEKALKTKLLDSLRDDPVHDFATDPHFTSFGRVIDPGK